MSLPTELTATWHITAAGCDAQGRLPLTTLTQRVIELATDHANILGVGYTRLMADGCAWVLSRISFEMERMPAMHEDYTMTTWIESFNRHFSERNFEVRSGDAEGPVIGHIRTVWVAIDIRSRRPADLSGIASLAETVSARRCPIEPQPKLREPEDSDGATVTAGRFRATDIDFNRHVTTVSYIRMILDQLPLEEYDRCNCSRLDVAFRHEAYFGEESETVTSTDRNGAYITAIRSGDRERTFCIARQIMTPRDNFN